ncbi:3'(2'),5'-bisphosphate nucleotidase CysQ [Pelagibacterium xiamenense]|uniref:3'(2'),5'-bisphosphate nucleotidase CysQ n=1 Tax=Pelagibacterium xiamenense TaxID=2901140 RepID=UPI001E52BCA1|nr:3'(2'),5'-bisphosphate nucleotidase CysQ [Pelagibacterium xiamenense]MCD7059226.1 3'(2'),5'-bisphosphate nucleotidase CysQ [Pelagibacterium xiamenense]
MSTAAPSPAQDDLALLRSAAVHAGIIGLGFFRTDLKTWTKNITSPVTEADIAIDTFLGQALLGARPDYGWLSEEQVDTTDRLDHRRVFVVDPIDGTRGFIKGEDSWCVSLAVVEDGIPVAGVVYAPARDEMYAAALGRGATLNGQPLRASYRGDADRLIPAPGAVHTELQSAGLVYEKGPMYPSLAYRLVQVARGKLDATVARRGAQDWDIAGADIILAEAGADFRDACAGRPHYNRADTRHGALAATADPSLKDMLCDALRTVYGCPDPTTLEQSGR